MTALLSLLIVSTFNSRQGGYKQALGPERQGVSAPWVAPYNPTCNGNLQGPRGRAGHHPPNLEN